MRRNVFLFKRSGRLIIIACLLAIIVYPLFISAASSSPLANSSQTGKASWYDFKPGLFAASTIYPIGQKVRVYHVYSDKTVDVTINDYGPDPKIHPDRVIDLQKEAFASLATLGTGVISVRVEPLSATGQTLATGTPTKLPLAATIATTSASTSAKTSEPKRDLTKEKLALKQFTSNYGRLPKTTADWGLLHQLAYNSKTTKTNNDFQQLIINNQDATAAIILDADNNNILWQKDAQKIVPIASLTKMVALKTFLDTKPNLEKIVVYKQQDEQEITKYCLLKEAALLKLKDQDQIKIKDLVYSALIGSANNAVESLVRISGLSHQAFVAQMNTNAKKWGALNTKFVEPTGLSVDNVSTAKDYALILKNISQDTNIKKISTTAGYKFTTINTKQTHTVKNTNKLLTENQFPLQSSKTGYLVEAGHCLAMTAQNQATKQKFIVVTLGSSSWSKSYQTASQILATALN